MDITTANVNYYENPLRAQSLIDILSKDYNVTDESLLRVLAGLGEGENKFFKNMTRVSAVKYVATFPNKNT